MDNDKNSIFFIINEKLSYKIVFFIASMVFLLGIFSLLMVQAQNYTHIKAIIGEKISLDYKIYVSMRNAYISDDRMIVEGVVMRQNSTNEECCLLFKKIQGGEELYLSTKLIEQNGIDRYADNSGKFGDVDVVGTIDVAELDENTCYEILVYLDCLEGTESIKRKISSGQYIYNGELFRYNPVEYEPPHFADDKMQEVIRNGELFYFGETEKIWIYVYQEEMYWIVNQEFEFAEDGLTYIPCQLYTFETNKLPENRIEDGFDNLDFRFEKREILAEGEYRVACQQLPHDYMITWVKTGLYDFEKKTWILQILIPLMTS